MAALTAISTVVGLVGTAVQAAGTLAAGREQRQALEYEAKQLDIEGKQRQAEAQLEGEQYKRDKELALSRLQAVGAASGFTATDPTALALADEIARYGTLQEQLAGFGGKRQRAGLEAQAEGRRLTGRAVMQGARYDAAGTILGGISSFAGKYAKKYAPSGGGNLRYGAGYG